METNQTKLDENLLILPHSSTVLILGILSIFLFCFAGIVSLIMGILALILAQQANQEYQKAPQLYTLSSYQNVQSGKTCAIVGLLLSVLSLVFIILFLLFGIGIALSFLPFCT